MFLGAALLVSATALLAPVLKSGIASALGYSMRISSVQRAVALDPANAKLWDKLGWLEFTSDGLDSFGPPADAIRDLRRATGLAPEEASYWADLGRACESAQDPTCAVQAFNAALSLSPMTPRLHWLKANHDVRAGDMDDATREFRKVLSLDPEYAGAVFEVCVRVAGTPELVWQQIIPRNERAQLDLKYASFLCDAGRPDVASRVWQQILLAAEPFTLADASAYLQRLFSLARYRDAEDVWKELVRRSMIPAGDGSAGNLVYNGGFEWPSLKTGFDWTFSQPPYALVDPSGDNPYEGRRCLRIEFPVKRNEEYEPAYEWVPVERNREYQLDAYARSESITSDSGLRLRVKDPEHPGDLDAASDSATGTTPWHRVSLRFHSGASTEVVRVSVWRPRSRSYPPEISGTFWLDDISIRQVQSLRREVAQK
jgi:hypothetical protein